MWVTQRDRSGSYYSPLTGGDRHRWPQILTLAGNFLWSFDLWPWPCSLRSSSSPKSPPWPCPSLLRPPLRRRLLPRTVRCLSSWTGTSTACRAGPRGFPPCARRLIWWSTDTTKAETRCRRALGSRSLIMGKRSGWRLLASPPGCRWRWGVSSFSKDGSWRKWSAMIEERRSLPPTLILDSPTSSKWWSFPSPNEKG